VSSAGSILVLTPDMRLDGGVTNYYRQLALDSHTRAALFSVNNVASRGVFDRLAFLLPNYLRYLALLRGFSCVHVNPSLNAKSFYRDAVYALLARLGRKKLIVTFHGWSYDFERVIEGSRVRSLILRKAFSGADAIVVLGQTFKQRLLALGISPPGSIRVETTIADDVGFDAGAIRAQRRSAASIVNFLFLARAVEEKGLFIAVDAFERCRSMLPDVDMHLFVAGDGPDLEAAKARCAGRRDVSFLGHVDDHRRRELLKSCQLLLFPTYHGEGLPCTILEAMLYGLPVLTRPEGAIAEVVEHGKHGFVTASRDPAVFAEFAAQLVRDPQAYQRMSECNMAEAMGRFRTEVVRERLLGIYDEVLSNRA
jgi:glycosyltransferase involved in cell wall biosynthesis